MILSALTRFPPSLQGFSPTQRKADSLLTLCFRFVEAVSAFRLDGREALAVPIREEKRRSLKIALSLIASQAPPESVRPAFGTSGLGFSHVPSERCETEMLIAGTEAALRGAHPVVIARLMSAYLGVDAFAKAEAWLTERFRAIESDDRDLIIPGDLPEVLLGFGDRPGALALAARLAGPPLVSAACAGCPRESVRALAQAAYNELGTAVLEDGMRAARARLSSDELADAQNAFLALIESVSDSPEASPGGAADTERTESADRSLVSEISSLVMELDEKLLKSVVSALDPRIIASMLQAMEPLAHDRLFSCAASGKGKKILDALEAASPQGAAEITRNAQLFSQKVLAEVTPRGKSRSRTLALPAQVRASLSALLGRE